MPRTVYLLALVAAFTSAGATIFIRQGLRGSTPFAGFWINLAVGTIFRVGIHNLLIISPIYILYMVRLAG